MAVRCLRQLSLLVSFAGRRASTTSDADQPDADQRCRRYAAVGASDGIGFGGSVPCVPFDPDCPSGTGLRLSPEAAAAEPTGAPSRSATVASRARC